MAIQRNQPEEKSGEAEQADAGSKKILELQAELEKSKVELAKTREEGAAALKKWQELDGAHSSLLSRHEALVEEHAGLKALFDSATAPAAEAKPPEPPPPSEAEKEEFLRVRAEKFKNGMVYCQAVKTVFGCGEVKYPGQRFWQRREHAAGQEKNGDLEILAEED